MGRLAQRGGASNERMDRTSGFNAGYGRNERNESASVPLGRAARENVPRNEPRNSGLGAGNRSEFRSRNQGSLERAFPSLFSHDGMLIDSRPISSAPRFGLYIGFRQFPSGSSERCSGFAFEDVGNDSAVPEFPRHARGDAVQLRGGVLRAVRTEARNLNRSPIIEQPRYRPPNDGHGSNLVPAIGKRYRELMASNGLVMAMELRYKSIRLRKGERDHVQHER